MSRTAKNVEPDISITDPFVDERSFILSDLDKRNPDYVHAFVSKDIKDWELRMKGMEFVVDSTGNRIEHGSDPVVKIVKKQHESKLAKEHDRSRKIAAEMAGDERAISKVARPVEVQKKE